MRLQRETIGAATGIRPIAGIAKAPSHGEDDKMTEKTVKIDNLEIEFTFDTQTGEIVDAAMYRNRGTAYGGAFNLRPYKGKGLLFQINPLGEGWAWNKQEEQK